MGIIDFQGWVLEHLQAIIDSGDEVALKVADEIDADLVSINEGLLDEDGFRKNVRKYITAAEANPVVLSNISAGQ